MSGARFSGADRAALVLVLAFAALNLHGLDWIPVVHEDEAWLAARTRLLAVVEDPTYGRLEVRLVLPAER